MEEFKSNLNQISTGNLSDSAKNYFQIGQLLLPYIFLFKLLVRSFSASPVFNTVLSM